MTRTNALYVSGAISTLLIAWAISAARPSVAYARAQAAPQSDNMSSVTKQQFETWMTELSNWGRWGKDDQRGALNLITDQKRRQAALLAKTGASVSLSRPIARNAPAGGTEPRPVNTGGAFTSFFLINGSYLFERQEIEYHGITLSHFDALCHVSFNGKLYNDLNFKDVVTKDGGCSKLGVTAAQDGIVTRGVLLDLPGTRVQPADIQAWEKRTGIKISAGDALLLRTKKSGAAPAPSDAQKMAGYDPALIPFFKERDIALLGSDVPQEGGQIAGVPLPIHQFMLVARGVNLLDNLALDDLAATAERLKRWEFMLVIEPLRVQNGAGSAINPVAVF
jgi:kynurenine formamidase